jgi:hypothetical protein
MPFGYSWRRSGHRDFSGPTLGQAHPKDAYGYDPSRRGPASPSRAGCLAPRGFGATPNYLVRDSGDWSVWIGGAEAPPWGGQGPLAGRVKAALARLEGGGPTPEASEGSRRATEGPP